MVFHRWGTISHIISTTKLPWCEKSPQDQTGDGTWDKEAIAFTKAVQSSNVTKKKNGGNGEDGGEVSRLDRRGTIHQISANHRQTRGGQGENVNLERDFRQRFKSIRKF